MPSRSKYGAKKATSHGYKFDSIGERDRFLVLFEALNNGEIFDLELQPKFTLQPAFTDESGKKHRAITYRADFRYKLPNGAIIVEDFKGVETAVFKLKKKMLFFSQPHVANQFRTVRRVNARVG